LTDPARALLAGSGLDGYVTWFHATALNPIDVSTWWDLASLRAQYEAFLKRWAGAAANGSAGEAVPTVTEHAVTERAVTEVPVTEVPLTESSGSGAFAGYLRLIDDWRLFPRIDPGLPAELLPADWPGPAAWQAFRTLRARWSDRGLAFLRQMIGAGEPAAPAPSGA
jgi:phenylacetic acid degradation operon negative regulatory protein